MSSEAPIATDLRSTVGAGIDLLAFAVFAAAIVVAPFLRGAIDPDTIFVLRMLVLASLILTLTAATMHGRLHLPSRWVLLPLAGYLAVVFFGAYRSTYAFGSVQSALDTLVASSGFLVAASLTTSARRRWFLLAGFLAGTAALSAIGVLQGIESGLVEAVRSNRASSLYNNPNHYGGLLDLAAPLALSLMLFARNLWTRLVFIGLTVLLYVNIGFTFSYGAWMSAGTATTLLLAAWGVRGWVRHRSVKPLGVIVLLLAFALYGGIAFIDESPRLDGDTLQRIESLLSPEQSTSLASRRAIQLASLKMTLDNPWLGVGPGNFSDTIVAYRPEKVTQRGEAFLHRTVLHALNDYLNVATETGIPGLVAFVGFWLMVLVRAPRNVPAAIRYGCTAALGAILLHGLVDGNLTYVTGNAFLAFAIAGVLHAQIDDSVT